MADIEAGRKENILYQYGEATFPFYVAPFDDTFFNSKLISGTSDSGIEIYFELDLNTISNDMFINSFYFPEEHTVTDFINTNKQAILDCIKCKLLIGPLVSFYDSNSYSDIASAANLDLTPNIKNIFKYSELVTAVSNWVSQSTSGGTVELGYARVCFYLDYNAYQNIIVNAGATVPESIGVSFPFDIKINNLYMQKLVIPYIEPPRVDPANTKSYINDKLLDLSVPYTVTDKADVVKTGTAVSFTDQYGVAKNLQTFKFKPALRDDLDPLKQYLGPIIEGPHNLRVMNPEQATPTGSTLGIFKMKANKYFSSVLPYLIDVEYSDSPANYGLAAFPISSKLKQPSNAFLGFVVFMKKSDMLAAGVTEARLTEWSQNDSSFKFNLTHKDGTTEEACKLAIYYSDGGTNGGEYRSSSPTYPSLMDDIFKNNPDAVVDLYGAAYVSYFNNYISKSAPYYSTTQYTPNSDAMNIMTISVAIELFTSTSNAFVIADKMDTILELPSVQEIAYLQVGAYSEYGSAGEYACYRIYASKDGKVWDYLGDSIGLSKTTESNEFYQYLSIDISNIAEPDSTKTYSKIKGKVLKVTIPDNNMYLRNVTTGVVENIAGSKEFAIRDIVVNNSGTILDFTLSGLTKLTYKGEVFEGEAADTKFAQLLKDTDFLNIDFTDLKAEGSELLINLGSEKEFDTVNIITGKTVTGGIQEMKYSVTISSDGSTFTDVISMDPATFTAEMFLKRTGMLVMNSNCFFTDD